MTTPRSVPGTVIYTGVETGDGFSTGHNALVREDTDIGDDVLVGTDAVLDGTTDHRLARQPPDRASTSRRTPRSATRCSSARAAVLTNDPHPVRREADLAGPTLEDGVSVGANATLLPDITIGEGSFVAAGAVVTRRRSAAKPSRSASPARPSEPLPDSLSGGNTI